MYRKICISIIILITILIGRPVFADWCEPVSTYEVYNFEPGSLIKYAYTSKLYDKLYYYNLYSQFNITQLCLQNNDLSEIPIVFLKEREAEFVAKSIASSFANELLRASGIDEHLHFKFRFDLDPPPIPSEKKDKSAVGPDGIIKQERRSFLNSLSDNSAVASSYLIESLGKFTPQQDVSIKVSLGETLKVRIRHDTHYLEPGYNIYRNRFSIIYKERLETFNYRLGILSLEYYFPQDDLLSLNGYVQARYTIHF